MASTHPVPADTFQGQPLRLRKRADFLKARSGSYAAGRYVRIQVTTQDLPALTPRIGFTVSKKNGNAVMRNRIKRRLRAAADGLPGSPWRAGTDYVIISKPQAISAPFDALKADLADAICKAERRLRHPA